MIQTTLGEAETMLGNFSAAEHHLQLAQRLAGPAASADLLVSMASLRQAQCDFEAAEALVRQALLADKNSALALLHMGYMLLCREQFDGAIQYLQKCLQQPFGTLTYGPAQKGTAHLYLCVAQHWYSAATRDDIVDQTAQVHFQSAYTLQPDLRRALAAFILPSRCLFGASARECGTPETACQASFELGARLVSGSPSRMGMVDLTTMQAGVLLLYAEACGLAPSSTQKAAMPDRRSDPKDVSSKPAQISIPLLATATTATLVGTSSTTAPSSPGPSRVASDPTLVTTGHSIVGTTLGGCRFSGTDIVADVAGPRLSEADIALALSRRLSPEQVLQLANIELGECISRGEFAVVHRGKLPGSGLDVVVKSLHQRDTVTDGEAAAELLAEIAVIAELRHPRIVTFVGACLEPTHAVLVTKLASGGSLHHALHVKQRRLARHECFQLASDLLDGVLYLHSQRPVIAHLDLKSMNLVLDASGQHLQICDFGLARALEAKGSTFETASSSDPRVRPPSRAGSPRYMAPECYDSSLGEITERADIWSSGCVLIEIFGGCLPYAECGNVQQILQAMLLQRCGPRVPASIESAVRGIAALMLEFDALLRPSIAQVLPQLQLAACGGNTVVDPARFLWVSP
jgi:hypothetical protein